MHHQLPFRKGWQSENLALYFLHQFAFVARPYVVADDIGIDFYCTLFETKDKKHLVPRNPFAIQIKSNKNPIKNKSGKVDFFNNLDVPFFIGVVNEANCTMEVYSGEHLPHFAPWKGNPLVQHKKGNPNSENGRVKFVPCRENIWDPIRGILETGKDHIIKFPLIGEATIEDHSSIQTLAAAIQHKCSLIQRNIVAWKSGAYVLETAREFEVRVYAGETSAQTFRANLCYRLAEAFMNMKWLHENRPMLFDLHEFKQYDEIYCILERNPLCRDGIIPAFNTATELRAQMHSVLKNNSTI